jgi:uncharacterized Zn-finger protein
VAVGFRHTSSGLEKMSHELTFEIAIPTDEGFVGRACDAPECQQYFKIYLADHREHLYCPYCGIEFHKNSLLTSDQREYVTEYAKEEAKQYAVSEIQKMFKKAFGSSSAGRGGISFKLTTPHVPKRVVRPRYTERKTDTELQCPTCNTRFQVYGIFGYCPGCRAENLKVYDANWSIIQREIAASHNPDRALRHAYSDLVSTFEAFCNRKAERLTTERCNSQILFEARRFFVKHASVDILSRIATGPLLSLRRAFQKRHVYIHNNGEITDKYIRMIPEDAALLGDKAELRLDELKEAADAMRTALGDLVKAVERKG